MLDLRTYRASFVPSLLVVVVCAFSLANRPAPSTATLAPGAFDALRAYGPGEPPQPSNSLRELAASFPGRPPGSDGDARLASRVAQAFRAEGFQVEVHRREAVTVEGKRELETVVGTRPGLSSRRIVVVAHRDAVEPGSAAALSGTAALLELARVFRVACPEDEPRCGRELRRTLVLVSTSGGSGGAGGARNWARRAGDAPVDAVLVLGDLAGSRVAKPWVVSFSNGRTQVPLALRRTVEAALRRETGGEPGASRASAQWARRAFPMTPGEEAELAEAGMPAVLISASGERGPRPSTPVLQSRLEEFGRGALRAISAIDAAGVNPDETIGPAFPDGGEGIVTLRRVLPEWAVRLLIGALLLPAVLAALDGIARVRRRRRLVAPRLTWIAAAVVPFALTWAWVRLLGLVVLDAPAAPLLPDARPLDASGWAALASVPVVFVASWRLARPVAERLWATEADDLGDTAAAAGVLAGLGVAAWVLNPYAAAVLLGAVHLGILLAAPEGPLRGRIAWLALAGALLLPAAVLVHYAGAFDLNPAELAWMLLLAFAGGHVEPLAALAMAVLAGAFACALRLGLRRPPEDGALGERRIVTRGPLGYAGPGSLGGTDSALRD